MLHLVTVLGWNFLEGGGAFVVCTLSFPDCFSVKWVICLRELIHHLSISREQLVICNEQVFRTDFLR